MKTLYLIPARGGSKGIPNKNIKLLNGKPLIEYSINVAREITSDDNICISTDDQKIVDVVTSFGLSIPFIRPKELATDLATTTDVAIHAINYYNEIGKIYDTLILLQPTSPLRTSLHVMEAIELYNESIDMVVSVRKSHSANIICNENSNGFLELMLNTKSIRRQDFPEFYDFNGAVYVINVKSLLKKGISGFDKKVKYIMPENYSIDIDNPFDWFLAETLLNYNLKGF